MQLTIKELELPLYIGVYDWEQEAKRSVLVNLMLEVAYDQQAKKDTINDTIDYDILTQTLEALANKKRYKLIETFASDIIEALLPFRQINTIKVEVIKPEAITQAKFVSVQLTHIREVTTIKHSNELTLEEQQ